MTYFKGLAVERDEILEQRLRLREEVENGISLVLLSPRSAISNRAIPRGSQQQQRTRLVVHSGNIHEEQARIHHIREQLILGNSLFQQGTCA